MTPFAAPRSRKYHLNRVHTLFELGLRRASPTNVPIYCLHEPTTGCNLRCPACPTGAGIANVRQTATLEDYEEVCAAFGSYLDVYYLFNWGEPTMSKHFGRILDYLRAQPFHIHLSTNFSVPVKNEIIEALAVMPNLVMRIDVDGATQEVHEQYRVNAKLSLVLEQAEKLSAAVKKSATPPQDIYFGFLNFDFNKDHVEPVRKMAKDLGFRFENFGEPLQLGKPSPLSALKLNPDFGCTALYTFLTPTPNLDKIAPCCGVWDGGMMSERPAGSSLHETFMNEARYKERRRKDAAFAKLPFEQRVQALKDNAAREHGMALRQAESDEDVCQRCSMGDAYQAKLGKILASAINSYGLLTNVDSDASAQHLTHILNAVNASNGDAFRARLVDILDMPPAERRGIRHYAKFEGLLHVMKTAAADRARVSAAAL